MSEPLRIAVSLGAGLLIGSVLPCELFARWRRVDISAVGDGNPGAYNALCGMGPVIGVITAVYDLSAGVVSVLVAHAIGVSSTIAYLAGALAIVGHRFPVYKRFRGGGQAQAAAAGLVVYSASLGIANGWLSWFDLGSLVAIGAVTLLAGRAPKDIAIVMLPVLVFMSVTAGGTWEWAALVAVSAGHIWLTQVVLALRARALSLAEQPAEETSSPE